MIREAIPEIVTNWIDHQQVNAANHVSFAKYSPADGRLLCQVSRSDATDVQAAVAVARNAWDSWQHVPGVERGKILFQLAQALTAQRVTMAQWVALETGKSTKDALAETDGAIGLAYFMAAEGQRLYGRTTTSGVKNKLALTVRQPVGVAGLIIAANTPIANLAWKVFPALVCGNSVVLKAAEDTPLSAWLFAHLSQAILPPGVLNVIQGLGAEAGRALVAHPDVGVISFTGSTPVGQEIALVVGKRMAKLSLELGGKNPLVVYDDADLELAVKWALLSAFSNAGQRCAAASRLIVFEAVYNTFRDLLLQGIQALRVGSNDADDLGPVINERQLHHILKAIHGAKQRGGVILSGGYRLEDEAHRHGYYLAPTLIENLPMSDDISRTELFGPVSCLYAAKNAQHALALANDCPYGLTAAIHTKNLPNAMQFVMAVQAGVAVINGGTYGSEAHMPFGGVKLSGNGSREPGTEALDVYSHLKDIYVNYG